MKRCILGVITFFLSVQYGISIDIASYTFNNYGEICQGVYTINEDPFDNITEIAVTANRRMGIKIDMCGSTDYAITRIEIRKGDEVIATSEMSRTLLRSGDNRHLRSILPVQNTVIYRYADCSLSDNGSSASRKFSSARRNKRI